MSRMEIYGVKPDGEVVGKFELNNACLGAALVWTVLGEKYLGKYDYKADCDRREELRREGKDPDKEMGPFDPMGWTRVFRLQNNPQVSEVDWCVLMSTFDGCIIGKDQFEYVTKCFREFHKEFPNSHYAKCAEAIEKLRDESFVGYCVNATSVSQNPWWLYPSKEEQEAGDEEGRAFNVETDKKQNSGVEPWYFDPADRKSAAEERL